MVSTQGFDDRIPSVFRGELACFDGSLQLSLLESRQHQR